MRRQVGDGNVDRCVGFRLRDKPELAKLLARLEPVAAFDLDRGRSELGGVTDPPTQ